MHSRMTERRQSTISASTTQKEPYHVHLSCESTGNASEQSPGEMSAPASAFCIVTQ